MHEKSRCLYWMNRLTAPAPSVEMSGILADLPADDRRTPLWGGYDVRVSTDGRIHVYCDDTLASAPSTLRRVGGVGVDVPASSRTALDVVVETLVHDAVEHCTVAGILNRVHESWVWFLRRMYPEVDELIGGVRCRAA